MEELKEINTHLNPRVDRMKIDEATKAIASNADATWV